MIKVGTRIGVLDERIGFQQCLFFRIDDMIYSDGNQIILFAGGNIMKWQSLWDF